MPVRFAIKFSDTQRSKVPQYSFTKTEWTPGPLRANQVIPKKKRGKKGKTISQKCKHSERKESCVISLGGDMTAGFMNGGPDETGPLAHQIGNRKTNILEENSYTPPSPLPTFHTQLAPSPPTP